jgi:hypothetical protein
MKKIFQITVIMLSAWAVTNVAQAQVGAEDILTQDVALSVTMQPIQILTVDGNQVNLLYASKDDYDNGVVKTMPDHLSVYSIGAFNVTVKSLSETLNNDADGVSATIDSEGITIKAEKSATNELTYEVIDAVVKLGTAEKTIITSNEGGVGQTFNITYEGEGGNNYVSRYFSANGAESVYKTTVTYTISAN